MRLKITMVYLINNRNRWIDCIFIDSIPTGISNPHCRVGCFVHHKHLWFGRRLTLHARELCLIFTPVGGRCLALYFVDSRKNHAMGLRVIKLQLPINPYGFGAGVSGSTMVIPWLLLPHVAMASSAMVWLCGINVVFHDKGFCNLHVRVRIKYMAIILPENDSAHKGIIAC